MATHFYDIKAKTERELLELKRENRLLKCENQRLRNREAEPSRE
jgi:hypothetical protein